MKNIIFLISLFLIAKLIGLERDLERAPLLPAKYTSLEGRATPEIGLAQPAQELRKRRTTLWNALNRKEVELVKSSLAQDFEWVNTLYFRQKYANNQVSRTIHEEMRHKLQFTRQLFTEIDMAIAKEDARQEWLRKFSAPGAIVTECCAANDCWNCSQFYPQWINGGLTVLIAALVLLHGICDKPSRLSIYDPCRILPAGQQAQMLLDCEQTSRNTSIPCVILNPHNATQIRLMEDCCTSLIEAFCLKNITHYNDHVYPGQMWHAWKPATIVLPSILALQVAFQGGGCLYRRSKRLREPIKQLIVQKKTDLTQIEQDFGNLQIIDDTSFAQL